MKIYFGFTVAGDRSSLDIARGVVELLESKGHEVLTRHLVSDNAWEQDRLITPQQVYERDIKWLEQCDLLIAEVSGSSFGLGFETGYCSAQRRRRRYLFTSVTRKAHFPAYHGKHTPPLRSATLHGSCRDRGIRKQHFLTTYKDGFGGITRWVCLAMLFLPPTCAGQARPYAGLLGGVSTLSADGQSAIEPPVAAMSSYKPGNGRTVDAFAGVHWNNLLSFQADYFWNRNPLKLDVLRASSAGGSMFYDQRFRSNQQTVLGNVLLYFRNRSSWVRPYLSVGTGIVDLAANPHATGVAEGLTAPAAFRSNMAALHVAVGIDLRGRRAWAFRYSFAETLSANPISRQLAPPGGRMLANFRSLFGIAKEF